jgi:hypothetical protein
VFNAAPAAIVCVIPAADILVLLDPAVIVTALAPKVKTAALTPLALLFSTIPPPTVMVMLGSPNDPPDASVIALGVIDAEYPPPLEK